MLVRSLMMGPYGELWDEGWSCWKHQPWMMIPAEPCNLYGGMRRFESEFSPMANDSINHTFVMKPNENSHIPMMLCSPQEKVTTPMDLFSILTGSHLEKAMWPRREQWLTLQCCCLETPMDRGTGGLQSIGSQRAGHNWSDLALDHKLVHRLFYLLLKIYQYF